MASGAHEDPLAIARDTSFAAELQLIDLANFASVQDFAKRIGDAPVDILVMNAGVAELLYRNTVDNWETTSVAVHQPFCQRLTHVP